ncbi:MAG: flagellar biosynthetic protein FliR [Kofleriaceae bacterium]
MTDAALATAVVLVLARVVGLAALAPVFAEDELPLRARVGLVVVLAAALAPLRLSALPAAAELPMALLCELGLGLATGAAARLALAAAEIAGNLASISLGFAFASQYDAAQGEGDVGRALARALATLTFLAAGGVEALVRAAAIPATGADARAAAELAVDLGLAATTDGLALAAPLLLASVVGNLAVALAHRAAAAVNLFAVGFAASLLVVGLAALSTSTQLAARLQDLVATAVGTLTLEAAR